MSKSYKMFKIQRYNSASILPSRANSFGDNRLLISVYFSDLDCRFLHAGNQPRWALRVKHNGLSFGSQDPLKGFISWFLQEGKCTVVEIQCKNITSRQCSIAFSDKAMLDQALLARRTLISGDTSIRCERMFPPVRISTAREPPFDPIFIRNI